MHRVSWTWSKQSSSGCSPPSVLKPPALLTSAENWSGVQLCHSQIFSEAQLLSWVLAWLQANPQPSLFQEFLNSSECSHHPQHHFVLSQLESTITFRCTLLLGDRRANSETKHHGYFMGFIINFAHTLPSRQRTHSSKCRLLSWKISHF